MPEEVPPADFKSNAFQLSMPDADEGEDPFAGIESEIAGDMSLQLSIYSFDEEFLTDINSEQ
ncbi:hypothetical protein THAOC_30670, partial [Thalassiosira oceanica]